MSYYNREWRGAIEVRANNGEWTDATGFIFGSVEHALSHIERASATIHDLAWRIVDRGGNVYETGRFPESNGRHGAATITDKFGEAVQREADELRALVNHAVVEFKDEAEVGRRRVPADVAARQIAAYEGLFGMALDVSKGRIEPESVHIRVSERRRLLEEALRDDS
jgi:hypothetical protein